MRNPRLRIYYGPEDELAELASQAQQKTVTVPLMDVLPLLVEAYEARRAWLRDFADEEITISTDLYEVLLAYEHFRRPSA